MYRMLQLFRNWFISARYFIQCTGEHCNTIDVNNIQHNNGYFFQSKASGKILFEQVCKTLNLLETDYFGLEYNDNRGATVSFYYYKELYCCSLCQIIHFIYCLQYDLNYFYFILIVFYCYCSSNHCFLAPNQNHTHNFYIKRKIVTQVESWTFSLDFLFMFAPLTFSLLPLNCELLVEPNFSLKNAKTCKDTHEAFLH